MDLPHCGDSKTVLYGRLKAVHVLWCELLTQSAENFCFFIGPIHLTGRPGDNSGLKVGGVHGWWDKNRTVVSDKGNTYLGELMKQVNFSPLTGAVKEQILPNPHKRQGQAVGGGFSCRDSHHPVGTAVNESQSKFPVPGSVTSSHSCASFGCSNS